MKRDTDTRVQNLDRVRWVSKHLYGNRYRLEIGAQIAQLEPGVFFARQIAYAVGIPDNVVQSELKRFESARLIQRLDTVPGQRALYFQRLDSSFWESCARLHSEMQSR